MISLDRERFENLEKQAAQLDAETGDSQSAKRRFLLIELNAAGIFDPFVEQEVAADLADWNLPVLVGYQRSAARIREYQDSPQRLSYIPHAASGPVLGGTISVDWFRLPNPPPESMSDFDWLAFCEFNFISVDHGSGAGEVFTRIGRQWCTIRYRQDDGVHPCIFTAEVTARLD